MHHPETTGTGGAGWGPIDLGDVPSWRLRRGLLIPTASPWPGQGQTSSFFPRRRAQADQKTRHLAKHGQPSHHAPSPHPATGREIKGGGNRPGNPAPTGMRIGACAAPLAVDLPARQPAGLLGRVMTGPKWYRLPSLWIGIFHRALVALPCTALPSATRPQAGMHAAFALAQGWKRSGETILSEPKQGSILCKAHAYGTSVPK